MSLIRLDTALVFMRCCIIWGSVSVWNATGLTLVNRLQSYRRWRAVCSSISGQLHSGEDAFGSSDVLLVCEICSIVLGNVTLERTDISNWHLRCRRHLQGLRICTVNRCTLVWALCIQWRQYNYSYTLSERNVITSSFRIYTNDIIIIKPGMVGMSHH
jgi:hypothetical protein